MCTLSFCVALCFIALSSSSALEPTIVVPNSAANTEGDASNVFPFGIGNLPSQRYQQLYAASQFTSIGSGGFITQIIFRPDASDGAAFTSTLPDMQIDLSTTPVVDDALSMTFADNVGLDDTVVFARGSLPLSSASSGGAPKDFDIVINLTTPFFYDPGMGNLLLDVRNFDGVNTTFFDADDTGADGVSRVTTNIGGSVHSEMANLKDTLGLVTGFSIAPNGFALTNAASELEGFDVVLPGIECRSAGARRHYKAIFTFNSNVVSVGGANISCGAVTSRTIDSTDPRRVILDLRDVFCNQGDVSIAMTDITDDQGNNLPKASAVMTLVVGDVTADGVVDQADVQQVQQHKGEVTDDSNFRADVNVDGQVSSLDAKLVRSLAGSSP